MKTDQAIAALGALAHEHRLAIFRALVVRGPDGLAAGQISERVGLAPSSLTFHLQLLNRAGLISQQRVGRQLIYATSFPAMNELVAYLTENCCQAANVCKTTNCAPAPAKSRATRSRKSA
jgi:DNA-binding transcriptional ArsR family regulator